MTRQPFAFATTSQAPHEVAAETPTQDAGGTGCMVRLIVELAMGYR